MPRAANPNSCQTCRKRKVKCDEVIPVCKRCEKLGLFCDRSASFKIKQYRNSSIDPVAVEEHPRTLLQHPDLARLFHIYIKELAPWYDLNDSTLSFGSVLPVLALDTPLLFAAVIAFSGTYASCKYLFPAKISEVYHARCVSLLIKLSPDDEAICNGSALAAVCLLRSYEILTEREDPNRHLLGASALLPRSLSLREYGLSASGFWNYLREDITHSLVYDCPLKVDPIEICSETPSNDDERANDISLLLAKIINLKYGGSSIDIFPIVQRWKDNFSATPFSKSGEGDIPIIRMFKDCQVAALHYYHVALCMLKPECRRSSAIEICGLAMGSESDAVLVNSYGPLCFAGQWLVNWNERHALIKWLQSTQKRTAWSVDVLLRKLQESWGRADAQADA